MTDQDQIIALSTWMGATWVLVTDSAGKPARSLCSGPVPDWMTPTSDMSLPVIQIHALPLYLNDLNAVAKLEAKLDEDTYNPGYIETLRKVIMDQEEIRGQGSDVLPNRIISATARQRCEALLRVLKLWKE